MNFTSIPNSSKPILLFCSAFNSMTQSCYIKIQELGYDVSYALVHNDEMMIRALEGMPLKPELIIAPMLKTSIPAIIWKNIKCLIIHPGPPGDQGPSSLDWALMEEEKHWGVSLIEACDELDAGPIWGSKFFPLRKSSKSDIYNEEVVRAGTELIVEFLQRDRDKELVPAIPPEQKKGCFRPLMKQNDRKIDWEKDEAQTILKKINAADSFPGVLAQLEHLSFKGKFYLYNAKIGQKHPSSHPPGTIIGQNEGQLCLNTKDKDLCLWIGHLRQYGQQGKSYFKLAATSLFPEEILEKIPHLSLPSNHSSHYFNIEKLSPEIHILHFNFYNGALGTEHCKQMLQILRQIKRQEKNIKVLILNSNSQYWCNGIHLNLIESSPDPELETWKNIHAIDDLIEEIILNTQVLTISAVNGHAGAGGVPLALASDFVYLREGRILNPHYKNLGLFGSEYWTYLLPRRVGVDKSYELTQKALPLQDEVALQMGLIDAIIPSSNFLESVLEKAKDLILDWEKKIQEKIQKRKIHEHMHPLRSYRDHELGKMKSDVYNNAHGFKEKRQAFVYKIKETP